MPRIKWRAFCGLPSLAWLSEKLGFAGDIEPCLLEHEFAKPYELIVREVVLCVICSPAADTEP